jgi:hypothetical protein
MENFELTHPEALESLDETGLNSVEMLEQTSICDFESCGLISTEQISDYIRETLPLTHLEGCPSIQYERVSDPSCPAALGTFYRGSHEIHIWGPTERFDGAEKVIETVTHEVGHNVHENLMAERPEVAERWAQLHAQSIEAYRVDGSGFVSEYARTNVYEDFAESYAAYVRDPERLQFASPEKYAFMEREVFAGREYAAY